MELNEGYIVGFADGEGTFNVVRYPDGRIRPQFLLFNTNKAILEGIKNFLNLSSAPIYKVSRVGDFIKRKKICYRLQVRSQSDMLKVIEFFDKNKPIVKIEEYNFIRQVWIDWTKDKF